MPKGKRKSFSGNNPKFKVSKRNEGYQNRFQELSDDSDDDSVEDHNVQSAKEDSIPPIVVDLSHSFVSVLKLIGNQYKFQRMSIGTKISSSNCTLYEEALKRLQFANFQYHTHKMKKNSSFKLVLFGLHKINCTEISEELKNIHNISPLSVKEIITKRSSMDDALYMLEFDRNHVTINEIRKIKYFYGIAVKWRKPLKGNRGPTLCSKCAMFGHGSANCYRNAICTACAGNHDVSTCTLNKTFYEGPVVYKCHNCIRKKFKNINHKADDINCPSRKEYLEIKQKLALRNKQKNNNSHEPRVSNYNHSTHDIPSTSTRCSGISYADIVNNQNKTKDNNEELSNERLVELYFEAIEALHKCKTKIEKLRVLGELLKHAI